MERCVDLLDGHVLFKGDILASNKRQLERADSHDLLRIFESVDGRAGCPVASKARGARNRRYRALDKDVEDQWYRSRSRYKSQLRDVKTPPSPREQIRALDTKWPSPASALARNTLVEGSDAMPQHAGSWPGRMTSSDARRRRECRYPGTRRRTMRRSSFTGSPGSLRDDTQRKNHAFLVADGLAARIDEACGAGHSTSTSLTLVDPDQSNCGGTPASPGMRQ